eukprot:COSAG02_NODE_119_length_35335_cov_12.823192_20_plen_65_part_00
MIEFWIARYEFVARTLRKSSSVSSHEKISYARYGSLYFTPSPASIVGHLCSEVAQQRPDNIRLL